MQKDELIKAPPRILKATLATFGIEELPRDLHVELAIRLNIEGAPLRDVGTYFLLVDRLYGRQDPRGLRSYAQRPRDQLEVKGAKTGSIEVVLAESVDFVRQHSLVLTWVLLRGIPHAGRVFSQMVGTFAAAYHDYEEGRLARARRLEIERRREPSEEQIRAVRAGMRDFLETDERFAAMRPDDRAELARLLAAAYLADEDQVRSIRHFAQERVVSIMLRINGRQL